MKCKSCGAPLRGNQCEYCGSLADIPVSMPGGCGGVTVNIHVGGGAYGNSRAYGGASGSVAACQPSVYCRTVSSRSWMIAMLLCVFFGYLGAHYFYVGRWGMGLLYLCTGGLCGIGWLADIFRILIGTFPDDVGLPVAC